MNRAELELVTEELELRERLLAAKEAHRKKHTDETASELAAAKVAVSEFRTKWRTIRDEMLGVN